MTERAVVTFTVSLLDTRLLCLLFVANIEVFALHIIFLCHRHGCCNAYGKRPLTKEVLIGQTLLLLNNALKPSLPEFEQVHSCSEPRFYQKDLSYGVSGNCRVVPPRI